MYAHIVSVGVSHVPLTLCVVVTSGAGRDSMAGTVAKYMVAGILELLQPLILNILVLCLHMIQHGSHRAAR